MAIEHAWGETVVPAYPERLVVLGYTDIDLALALGVTPVAYNDWFGTGELNPWAAGLPRDAAPEPIDMWDSVPIEHVLSFNPDLIVVTDNAVDRAAFDLLSKATTVVGPITDTFGIPRDEATLRMGKILGREDEARVLLDDLDSAFAAARDEHPEFAGRTVVYAWPGPEGIDVYFANDTRGQVLNGLGFEIADQIAEMATGDEISINLSWEQVGLLDADVLVVRSYSDDDLAMLIDNPIYQALDVVQRNAVVVLPNEISDGISFGTVLSIPYVIDQLVPLLAEVVE